MCWGKFILHTCVLGVLFQIFGAVNMHPSVFFYFSRPSFMSFSLIARTMLFQRGHKVLGVQRSEASRGR